MSLPALPLSLLSAEEAARSTAGLHLIIVAYGYPDSLRLLFLPPISSTGTFSSSESLDRCQPCASCPSSVPMLASCTATQDTHCECDNDFFLWGSQGLCAPCSKCTRGQGVVRECGPQGDTLCQICGPGTFSEEPRSSKPCQTCTKCSDSEVEIRACMPNSDTLCMGELQGQQEW